MAPELLKHRRNARIVEHNDSDQIYEGMVTLLADPELRETLRRNGWRSLEPRFTARTMQREIEDVYLRALAEVRPGIIARG